jgi:predicted transcriptional regulator
MKDSEKIIKLTEALNLNVFAFTKRLGLSKGTIYHIVSDKNSLSQNLIIRICDTFPEVNRKFLERGEFPVLNPYQNAVKNIDNDGFILIRKAELDEMHAKLNFLINHIKKEE